MIDENAPAPVVALLQVVPFQDGSLVQRRVYDGRSKVEPTEKDLALHRVRPEDFDEHGRRILADGVDAAGHDNLNPEVNLRNDAASTF